MRLAREGTHELSFAVGLPLPDGADWRRELALAARARRATLRAPGTWRVACDGGKKDGAASSAAAAPTAAKSAAPEAASSAKPKDPKMWPANKKSAHEGGEFTLEYENQKVKESYAITAVLTRMGSNGFIVDMLSSSAKCGDPVRTCNDCSFRYSMNVKKPDAKKVTDLQGANLAEYIEFPSVSGGINEMVVNIKHDLKDKRANAQGIKRFKITKIDEAAGEVEGEIEFVSDWFGTVLKGGGKFKGKLCK